MFEKIMFNFVKRLNGSFEGVGVGFGKNSYVKVGRAVPNSKGLWTHAILVKRVFNYWHLFVDQITSNSINIGAKDC